VTVGGNGQWHAEGRKILGRWARKNLHPFLCLGVLISLLNTHCTTYSAETWHLWSKNVSYMQKKNTAKNSQSQQIINEQ
jgi:hypothetical protein